MNSGSGTPVTLWTKWQDIVTELQWRREKANQLMIRIETLNKGFDKIFNFSKSLILRSDNKKYTPLFDIISLSNIKKPSNKDE